MTVTVQMIGGLGNQLFQYATGLRLAQEKNTNLKLDISAFEWYKTRAYRLGHFQAQEDYATQEELLPFTSRSLQYRLPRGFWKILPYYRRPRFREREIFIYDSNILKTPQNVYLVGYFQHEQYFSPIRERILADFTLRSTPSETAKEYANQAADGASICVSIRRGEYVTDPVVRRIHGVLPLQYYREAIEQMVAQVRSPRFFVFSDEIEWAQENLEIGYPTTWMRDLQDYEQLWIMSQCEHHIIANSSFSWWGAWMSTYERQIVIAPKPWFANPPNPSDGIVPDRWQTIPGHHLV